MRVLCVYQHGERLPDEVLALGSTLDTVFNVSWGHDYDVYSICLWGGTLHYLILNEETGRPDWFPACLFEVIDGRIPANWCYNYWGNEPNVVIKAAWGYPELVQDGGKHIVSLIEREEEAMAVFNSRRDDMDAQRKRQSVSNDATNNHMTGRQ